MNEETRLAIAFTALIVCVGVSFFSLFWFVESSKCAAFGRATGYETKFDWDCYAKVDGKFVPREFVFGRAIELRKP